MKYDAFISYRHLELDMYVAKQVHKRLETFKVPAAVAKRTGKKNIKRVFRDQEELPIGSDLGDNIKKALEESEYLIVICSTKTKESFWVQQEINTFIEMHGRDRVLAILIDGEPADSFPEQILVGNHGEPVEPLAADVRGANKKEINKKMQTEILRLAAPLLGCTYDDLRQRHKERKMKRVIAGTAIVATAATAFSAYSVHNTMMIQKNYEGKQINQSKYLADTAISLIEDGDRITAGLVALEALPAKENDRPYVTQAQYALTEALNAYRNGSSGDGDNFLKKDCLLKHDNVVDEIIYSQDGTKLASIDNSSNVYIWDVVNRSLLLKVRPELNESGYVERIEDVALLSDNQVIITTESKIRSLDLKGNEKWTLPIEDYLVEFETEQEKEIGVSVFSDMLQLVDLKNGNIINNIGNTEELGDFSNEIIFGKDGKKIAVSYSSDSQRINGAVKVWDVEANTYEDYEISGTGILELAFAEDGNLVVVSIGSQQVNGNQTYIVEKIDLKTKSIVWTNLIESALQIFGDDHVTAIRTRKYTDEATGEEYDEVILSNNNCVYTWNSVNGTLLSKIQVTDNVMAILLVENEGTGLVLENSGNMGLYNFTNGREYKSNYFQIENSNGNTVLNIAWKNGVMAVRMKYSPNILLLRNNTGYGMESIDSLEYTIMGMDYSDDESYYMIRTIDDVGEEVYHFYQTEGNLPIGEWSYGKATDIEVSRFINNSVYMLIDSDGNVVFYDVQAQEKNILEATKDFLVVDCIVSENNKYAFVNDGYEYLVADLQKQTWIAEGELEDSLTRCVITEDGKKVYSGVRDDVMIILDTHSGQIRSMENEKYTLYTGTFDGNPIAVSADGKLLAVCCMDGMLRIMDTKTLKTVSEVEFASYNYSYICFSPDGKKLVMQGDDYYIRVYDIEKEGFLYVNPDQITRIEKIVFNDETNTIGVLTEAQMLILNEADYVPLACVEYALAYMPKTKAVFNCDVQNTVYRFPYMDLEMLQEEAKRQFGDRKLTKQERIKYNID